MSNKLSPLSGPVDASGEPEQWVILEDASGLWWGPRRSGYTDFLRAGLYSEDEAKSISSNQSRRDRAFKLSDKLAEFQKLPHADERVLSALSAAAAVPSSPAHRFDCPACGVRIAVDEDGCCRTCGGDAIVQNGSTVPSSPAQKQK